jgi:hypothetical protein
VTHRIDGWYFSESTLAGKEVLPMLDTYFTYLRDTLVPEAERLTN